MPYNERAAIALTFEELHKVLGLPDWVTILGGEVSNNLQMMQLSISVPPGTIPKVKVGDGEGLYLLGTTVLAEGQIDIMGFTGPIGEQ